MPKESDEPLRKCTLNLFRKDVVELERLYGRGWTEKVRELVNIHVNNKRYLNILKQYNMTDVNG